MERPILKIIADNPALSDALKEMLTTQFQSPDDRTDDAMSDIQLGQMFRARLVGLQKIEEVFKEIRRYKTPETPKPRERMGR